MSDIIKKQLSEAKAKLNELVKLVEIEGFEIILMRHGKECARIVPIVKREKPNLFGCMQDMVSYPESADLDAGADAWGDIEIDGEKISLK